MRKLWKVIKSFYLMNLAIWVLAGGFSLLPYVMQEAESLLEGVRETTPSTMLDTLNQVITVWMLERASLNWLLVFGSLACFLVWKGVMLLSGDRGKV